GEEAEVAVPLRGSAAEVTRVLDRRVDHDASLIDRGLEAEVDAAEQAEGDGDRLSHPGCTAAERDRATLDEEPLADARDESPLVVDAERARSLASDPDVLHVVCVFDEEVVHGIALPDVEDHVDPFVEP